MNSIKNILVIVDPTASDQPAVQKAVILASKFHAGIELFVCDTKSSFAMRMASQMTKPTALTPSSLHSWLEALARPLRSKGIEVTTSAINGDPFVNTVLAWLKNSPADLVMKDTHHHGLTKRTFLGNTDWHLIRECPIPLLLTKPKHWREPLVVAAAVNPPLNGIQEDFLDKRILDCAVTIALPLQATVLAVHTYFPDLVAAASICPEPNFFNVTAEMLEAEKTLHQTALVSLLAPYGIAQQSVHLDMGVASTSLPEIAEQQAIDVMVMGAISRNHLKQALIGSTAERLLEHLPCDVLVIKETQFAECLPI
ncbi:MAG: universal stress protein [Pseudomonadota bacterium]|nr:universal stress protein [Pseudomonadota bacterium]